MENNLQVEIINSLAVKIANLEVQVAALNAENSMLRQALEASNNQDEEIQEDEANESSE